MQLFKIRIIEYYVFKCRFYKIVYLQIFSRCKFSILYICNKTILIFASFDLLMLVLLYYCSIASDPNIFVVLEDLVLLYYCSIASDPNIFVVLDLVLLYYAPLPHHEVFTRTYYVSIYAKCRLTPKNVDIRTLCQLTPFKYA